MWGWGGDRRNAKVQDALPTAGLRAVLVTEFPPHGNNMIMIKSMPKR